MACSCGDRPDSKSLESHYLVALMRCVELAKTLRTARGRDVTIHAGRRKRNYKLRTQHWLGLHVPVLPRSFPHVRESQQHIADARARLARSPEEAARVWDAAAVLYFGSGVNPKVRLVALVRGSANLLRLNFVRR